MIVVLLPLDTEETVDTNNNNLQNLLETRIIEKS